MSYLQSERLSCVNVLGTRVRFSSVQNIQFCSYGPYFMTQYIDNKTYSKAEVFSQGHFFQEKCRLFFLTELT